MAYGSGLDFNKQMLHQGPGADAKGGTGLGFGFFEGSWGSVGISPGHVGGGVLEYVEIIVSLF